MAFLILSRLCVESNLYITSKNLELYRMLLVKLFKLFGPLKVHCDHSFQHNGSDSASRVGHVTTLF